MLKSLLFVLFVLFVLLSFKLIEKPLYNPYLNESVVTSEELNVFLNGKLIPNNIFVHGTNSSKRLLEYEKYYNNFELDIFISEDNLDIYHYPEHASIGFYLNDFFDIKSNKTGKYWLDVKNLTINNVGIIDGVLSNIIKDMENVSMEDFLVESKNPEALFKLSSIGYKTSLYLPTEYTESKICPKKHHTTQLIKQIEKFDIKTISFHQSATHIVQKCLINNYKEMNYLTWNESVYNIDNIDTSDYEMYIINHHL